MLLVVIRLQNPAFEFLFSAVVKGHDVERTRKMRGGIADAAGRYDRDRMAVALGTGNAAFEKLG